ncbi:MAG: hypothetical protein WBW55_13610 [Desulfobaccales bacterium]
MNLREEIIKSLNTLSEEDLEGVWENINFIQEPGEVEPTAEEVAAISRGKQEIARGEVVRWRDLKKELDENAL